MKKVLQYLLIFLLVIVLAMIALPFMFKGKLVGIIREQANKNLNAKVYFNDDISIGFLSSFPMFSLGIKDISISGINQFEGDTLFAAKNLELSLDVMSVIKGDQIAIRKIGIEHARVHAIVEKDGKANWDITLPDTTAQEPADTAATPFNIKLKELNITNATIVYDDRQGDIYSELVGMNYSMQGDFTEKLFVLKNKLDVQSLTAGMGGVNYLNKVKTTADADIDADMNAFKFVFKENKATLNELELAFNGSFQMTEADMLMDITYAVGKNDFKPFLSLIPAMYSSSFKDLTAKGKLALEGFVKGTYNETSLPGFGLKLNVENGWFKYPALPAPVEDVQVDFAATCPDGVPNNTLVNLSKFHMNIQGDILDAALKVSTPVSDPEIDAVMKGRVNLGNVLKIVPLEGTKLAGIITSDVTAKGKISAIEKQAFDQFFAGGTIEANAVHVEHAALPAPMDMPMASLSFSPAVVSLNQFKATIGNSDFAMDGRLTNFFPYFFGNGILNGNLNFQSNILDVNALMGTETNPTQPSATDTAAMEVVVLPDNINFQLKSSINKLVYSNMEMTNFKGAVQLSPSRLELNQIALNMLGSAMQLNGFYETTNPKKPNVDMKFSVKDLDFQKAFSTFNTVQKLAPAAEHIMGFFSADIDFTSPLSQTMQPVMGDVNAKGVLKINTAKITQVKALAKLADLLKKPEYGEPGLEKAAIRFEIKNGLISTEPFDLNVAGKKFTVSGSTSLDQKINYTGTTMLNRKELGVADKAIQGALAQLNAKAGTQISMEEQIPLQINFGGSFTSPTITTNLGAAAKAQANSLKDQAAAELAKKKAELEAKAKAEAQKKIDEAKAELEKKKLEAETKAKSEAERLKKEAEAKAQAEKERLKKEAEEKAKAKLKGLFNK